MREVGVRGIALQALLAQGRPQTVVSRQGFVATTGCFLKSGVPNTTLYNSILNAMIHWYSFVKAGGRPGVDFWLMVRGDDNLGFVRPGLDDNLVADAEKLGFKLKLKRPGHPCRARFCSNAFYPVPDGRYMPAPTIGKCLPKLAYSIATVRRGYERAHLRGVALGLLALTNHVPLLGQYVKKLLEITAGAKGRELREAVRVSEHKYLVGGSFSPCVFAEQYVAQMYGVDQSLVSQMSDVISRMSEPGFYGTPGTVQFLTAASQVEEA